MNRTTPCTRGRKWRSDFFRVARRRFEADAAGDGGHRQSAPRSPSNPPVRARQDPRRHSDRGVTVAGTLAKPRPRKEPLKGKLAVLAVLVAGWGGVTSEPRPHPSGSAATRGASSAARSASTTSPAACCSVRVRDASPAATSDTEVPPVARTATAPIGAGAAGTSLPGRRPTPAAPTRAAGSSDSSLARADARFL